MAERFLHGPPMPWIGVNDGCSKNQLMHVDAANSTSDPNVGDILGAKTTTPNLAEIYL